MALSSLFRRGGSITIEPFSARVPYPQFFDSFEKIYPFQARHAKAIGSTQIDWRETPEAHVFKADIPGLKREEIQVQLLEGRTLEVSGERKNEEVQDGDKWHLVERFQSSFLRRFRLPENANADDVKAQVEDGVLTVTIPKCEKPKPEARQIEIA